MDKTIPKWMTVVLVPVTLLGFFVGFSLYISPGTFVQAADFSLTGSHYLANMWAARQIAIASILGYSLLRQSAVMLRVSLIGYFLMTFQDIFIGISAGDKGLIIGTSAFCILSASLIFVLSKKGDSIIHRRSDSDKGNSHGQSTQL